MGGSIGDGAIPTAELLRASSRAEAEDLLRSDGRWITDDRERNRCINRAYARLWLATGASVFRSTTPWAVAPRPASSTAPP